MLRLVGWSMVLVAVYVVGLIVIVVLSAWNLFIDFAGREWLAFWLVMPFAWAFGYWPVIGPLIVTGKMPLHFSRP